PWSTASENRQSRWRPDPAARTGEGLDVRRGRPTVGFVLILAVPHLLTSCAGVPAFDVRRSLNVVLFVLRTAAQRSALGKAGGRLPANASTPSRPSGLAAQE